MPTQLSAEQIALIRLFEISIECISNPKCTPLEGDYETEMALSDQKGTLEALRSRLFTRSSLKEIAADISVMWNEQPPSRTRAFWDRVSKEKLPFRRRDIVAEATKAGRIRTREEYEIIVDSLSEQSAEDRKKLNVMIEKFERRQLRRTTKPPE